MYVTSLHACRCTYGMYGHWDIRCLQYSRYLVSKDKISNKSTRPLIFSESFQILCSKDLKPVFRIHWNQIHFMMGTNLKFYIWKINKNFFKIKISKIFILELPWSMQPYKKNIYLFNKYSIIFSFCLPRTPLYPDSDRIPEFRLRESLPDFVGSVQGLSHRIVGLKNERGIPINIVTKALDTPVVNIYI